jgi:hypothetical protein
MKLSLSKFNSIFLVLFISIYANAQADWKFLKEDKGTQVYTKDHTCSKIKELKAVKIFKDLTVKDFYDLLKDSDNASKWSYLVNYSKTLSAPSDYEVIAYFQMDTPWPVKARDMVQRQVFTLNQDKSMMVCVSTSMPEYVARKDGFVRVEESDIKWTIKQINPTDVQVTYEFFSDPHAHVPSGIEQHFVSNGPILVLEKMNDYFRLPKVNVLGHDKK